MVARNTKLYGMTLALVLSAIMIFSLSNGFILSSSSTDETTDGSLEKVGIVYVAVLRGEGSRYGVGYEVIAIDEHNIVVNQGLNATRDLIGQGSTFGAFDIIALANGTAATADSVDASNEWTANGLSRVQGNYNTITGSAGNWTISTTFTSTTIADLRVNQTCLVNQTTIAGDTLFACVNFNQVTLDGTAGDTVFINWTNFVTSG